ncbi:MAG: lysine--tRNA ligase [Planctomycetota bacterium]|nr:lysine--tRNA ligase [Planctomycetota bacterium]
MTERTQPHEPNQPRPTPATPGVEQSEYEAQRRAKRQLIAELGLHPYGDRVDGLVTLRQAFEAYDAGADEAHKAASEASKAASKGSASSEPAPPSVQAPAPSDHRPEVIVAGRVILHRDTGKLVWMNLRDHTRDLQVAVSAKDADEKSFALVKRATDLGDVIVARGRLMKTKTGEVTVWASEVRPGAKSLLPPPAKHEGLQDVEIRYRQRYVDLWSNPETLRVFELRSKVVSRMRQFLEARGYVEVETPMMQTLAGGAAARPFVTHMNALGVNLFMRIAPELYLKRLLVGGMPKVFEINRNFRNEGLDKQHNPEFTMLETYHAFGDVETVMELTESIIRECAALVAKLSGDSASLVLPFGELQIDYSKTFLRRSYGELFAKAYGFEMEDAARAKKLLRDSKAGASTSDAWIKAVDAMDDVLVVNELFEDKQRGGEAQLDPARPTFITDYPAAISPLTRPKRSNPKLADRADLFIAGMEIAPHYTELNDPDVQEAKFREQLRGLDAEKSAEENTFRTMDHDFIRALKVGMPPAGGMGLGVDRLVMILANQRTIRDVVLFPLMRPEE